MLAPLPVSTPLLRQHRKKKSVTAAVLAPAPLVLLIADAACGCRDTRRDGADRVPMAVEAWQP